MNEGEPRLTHADESGKAVHNSWTMTDYVETTPELFVISEKSGPCTVGYISKCDCESRASAALLLS